MDAQDYLRINLKDGGVYEFEITNVRKITFDNLNSVTPEMQLIIKQLLKLKVYPNPAKEFVNVNYTLVSSGTVTLDIYSMNGVLMKSINKGNQQTGEHNFQLITSDFPVGIYNCVIRHNHEKISEKLIINK